MTLTTSMPGEPYLGHRDPAYTYYYLSAAPELLACAAGLLDTAQEAQS
jgi:integrase/recombinase XerD